MITKELIDTGFVSNHKTVVLSDGLTDVLISSVDYGAFRLNGMNDKEIFDFAD